MECGCCKGAAKTSWQKDLGVELSEGGVEKEEGEKKKIMADGVHSKSAVRVVEALPPCALLVFPVA